VDGDRRRRPLDADGIRARQLEAVVEADDAPVAPHRLELGAVHVSLRACVDRPRPAQVMQLEQVGLEARAVARLERVPVRMRDPDDVVPDLDRRVRPVRRLPAQLYVVNTPTTSRTASDDA